MKVGVGADRPAGILHTGSEGLGQVKSGMELPM